MKSALVLSLVLWSGFAWAATPRNELLRLVPSDTAVCLVVENLRAQSKQIAESPFAAWVQEHFRPQLSEAPELKQLQGVESIFRTLLGVSFTELRDDIFGDAIVLAYQAGTNGKADAEQGLLLVRVRDAAKLKKLLDRLNTAQQSTAEVRQLTPHTYRERQYFERKKAGGGSEYYFQRDTIFVFSGQEKALQAAIDRDLDQAVDDAGPISSAMDELQVKSAFLSCWINPRKLDADVKGHAGSANDAKDRAAREHFAKIWTAIDSLMLYLRADTDLEFGVAIKHRSDGLPSELQTVLAESVKGSSIWPSIPPDAIFAMSGRLTGSQLIDILTMFEPAMKRSQIRQEIESGLGAVVGRDRVSRLLTNVGPDWGLWLTPPTKGWVPSGLLAVRIAQDERTKSEVRKLSMFYSQLLQVRFNQTHQTQIESSEHGTWMTFRGADVFAAGIEPTHGVVDRHLILASSPDIATRARLSNSEPELKSEIVVLRIWCRRLEQYLATHRGSLTDWLAAHQGREREELRKELDGVLAVLTVLDDVSVVVRGEGVIKTIAVRVKPVKPLRAEAK